MRLWTLTFALLIAACAGTPPPADFHAADALARAGVVRGEFPSAAYALVRDGRIAHEEAVGMADRQAGLAATPHVPYPLASVTKPVAASALMLLAERGRVDLDRPASEYLAVAGEARYSVRQLLAHTAGLPTYARIHWADRAGAREPFARSAARYATPVQPPGAIFEYSNLGYGLVGQIIEARSGKSLGEFLRDELFAPLGMRHSMLVDAPGTPAGAARKHGADGALLADTWNDTAAAGNVYASAHDLARFAAWSLGHGGGPLSRAARQSMQRPSDPQALHPYYGGAGYGLGWYVRDLGGEPFVWHEGGMPGASSIVILLPRRKLAAVALINATDLNAKAQEIALALLRAVAPDLPTPGFVPTEGFDKFAGQGAFVGAWNGTLEIDGRAQAWTLSLGADGAVQARFPGGQPQSAYMALVHGDFLLATLPGRLPGADVAAEGGLVLLRLVRRGDTLEGMAIAYASEQRLEHLLPFKARLSASTPSSAAAPESTAPRR